MTKTPENVVFWTKILNSVGAEYRECSSITGISGISHVVTAIGIDDKGKRLIVISGEHDAKSAALSQVDIQLTMPDVRVCIIRPVLVSLPQMALALMDTVGTSRIYFSRLQLLSKPYFKKKFENKFKEFIDSRVNPTIKRFESVPVSVLAQLQYVMQQIISPEMGEAVKSMISDEVDKKKGYINLSSFEKIDVLSQDRALGICGMPLFEFSESDINFVLSGRHDDIKSMLIDRDIYQFFFPSPDSAILGLIERGSAIKQSLSQQVGLLPQLGHPLGEVEIVKPASDIPSMVEQLQDLGLLVEGEMNLTLSEKGQTARGKIKFKPREGVMSKLANKLKLNIGMHFHN